MPHNPHLPHLVGRQALILKQFRKSQPVPRRRKRRRQGRLPRRQVIRVVNIPVMPEVADGVHAHQDVRPALAYGPR